MFSNYQKCITLILDVKAKYIAKLRLIENYYSENIEFGRSNG